MAKCTRIKSRSLYAGRCAGAPALVWAGVPAAAIALALIAGSWDAQANETKAGARLHDRNGTDVGTVAFTATPNGVRLHADLHGLPAGTHGFHLHAIGRCVGDFKSAGGHYNPDGAAHGFDVADGPHQGDMPNIHVDDTGRLEIEVFLPDVRLAGDGGLVDSDGAAVVIHAGSDDYHSQPSGAAGPRIACGVIGQEP
ncbi:MAG: superoxide dismutase family protein [Alphaproteobacteria bacterium]|nr:MAG: superoxide dismutase family protein [Alphaproteobacteria bacterium]